MSRAYSLALASVFVVSCTTGCELGLPSNDQKLFGQRPQDPPPGLATTSTRPQVRDNESAAHQIEQYVQTQPRPIDDEGSSVVPMGARSLASTTDQARPLASMNGAPPRVEWVSVVGVEPEIVPLNHAPPLQANSPAASHAQPVVTVDPALARLEMAVNRDPNDIDAQLRLRHLYLANGWTDRALAAPEGMDRDRADVLMTWMRAMAEGGELVREPMLSVDASHRFAALEDTIRRKSQLEIPRIALCSTIHSFGRYDVVPDGFLVAGGQNRVLIYCEVSHFGVAPSKDGFETRIAHRLELLDPSGNIVWQDEDYLEVVDYCSNQRTDFFFNRFWQLPVELTAGEYVLNVIVADRVKSQVTEAKHPINILASGTAARR